jgi:hypothetical protein
VKFTRGVAIVVLLFYVFLWVLALNGVSSLVPLLAVPVVLAVLVAFGVWLNRFMGIAQRQQHFQDRPEDDESTGSSAPVDEPTDHGDARE